MARGTCVILLLAVSIFGLTLRSLALRVRYLDRVSADFNRWLTVDAGDLRVVRSSSAVLGDPMHLDVHSRYV